MEEKFKELINQGWRPLLVAEQMIKAAESRGEFLKALQLLIEAHVKEREELPKVGDFQRKFFRYVNKHFGVNTIMDALMMVPLGEHGITAIQTDGKGPYRLSFATGATKSETPQERLKAAVYELMAQKKSAAEIKAFVREFKFKHRLPVNENQLYPGETLEDLKQAGYTVE